MSQLQIFSPLREKIKAAINCGFLTKTDQDVILNALFEMLNKEAWQKALVAAHLKVLRGVPAQVREFVNKAYRLGVNKKKFEAKSPFRSGGCRVLFFKMGLNLVVVDIGNHEISLLEGEAPDFQVPDGVYFSCDQE